MRKELLRLRERMQAERIDAWLIMTDDFHGSEYVGDYFKCREYISGFTGSAGTLLVLKDHVGLWTDGRYFLQAKEQLEATVFMVTHDSYAASFCDRVIVLRDGAVHTELTRRGSRREFMDELLDVLRELGGDRDDQE